MEAKLKLKTPDEAEVVYYEAFLHCDSEVMAALWAAGDVICVHPGSGAIVGHAKVLRSWQHIFNDAQRPVLTFSVVKRTLHETLAVHLVAEAFETGDSSPTIVLATNVYQKFDQGWLMIEHHGSLVQTGAQGQTLQ